MTEITLKDLKNNLRIPEDVNEDDSILQVLLDSGKAYIISAVGEAAGLTEDARFNVAVLTYATLLYQNNGEYSNINGLPYTLQALINQLKYSYI